ncbi:MULTISPECIES: OmpA family protein [unclassified Polaribacter]|uniref:OmpA family protein n=1 Tax=unclassified Polaribacter TaxID=196858 RepID=UPI0011BE8BF7|nr:MULTISPECIES: OmpA family protein [unclassified Polaribacter]TXD54190.1 OmpA family protein [Polaribacter sp. IC063]TXD62455.1 OmpA family protein [Polaribacter sp. IC066]
MNRLKIAVIALFALVAVGNLSAQDENNPWAIGFGINAVDVYNSNGEFFGSGGQIEDLLGTKDWNILPSITRITAEKYLEKGFSLQLAGSINKIDFINSKNDVDLLYWSIDAVVKYDLNRLIGETGWFDPYVLLGGSYVSLGEEGEGMLNAGFGFNTWINDNFGFNFQHSSKIGFADKINSHYQTSVGLVIKFGGKDTDGDGVYDREDACPNVSGLPEFNGCPDADGDGIKDSDDACPNTAGLAAMNGCPDSDGDGVADKDDMCANEKGTKANKGCPDSDGDGVLDKDDKCISEAGPAANNGCPWPDTDGDGVLDKDDKCKSEVGPASNGGCPEAAMTPSEIAMLAEYTKGLEFAIDRAEVNKDTAKKLDRIYDLISPIKEVIFVVEGYTDSTGAEGYNLYLSERRAESAKAYLVKKGFDADRLETLGYGEKNPLSTNNTRSGRKDNRRVLVQLTE